MRKSTLFMGLLLAAGFSAAAEYVVPEVSTADAPKYYKIVSNRALTLSYRAENGSANAIVEAGQGTFGQRPYVGLQNLNRAAISNDPTYVPDASLIWSFLPADNNTTGNLEDGVMWVNLYSPSMYLAAGNGASDYAHLTTEKAVLYVFNLNYVNENAEKNGNEAPYWNNSYCISRVNSPSSACFDVKNYVGTNQSWEVAPYAFMAAEWNPFSDMGVDQETGACSADPNGNNGSVFYFEVATDEEVAKAKEDLKILEQQILEEQGPGMVADAKEAALNSVIAYANVPALWDAASVASVISEIEAMPLTHEGYTSVVELQQAINAYTAAAAEKTAGLVSSLNGKVVTFKNVQRPYQGIEGTPAYLVADVEYSYDPETGDEITTPALMVGDDASADNAKWTLVVVDGGVKLYNEAMGLYPTAVNPAVNQSWVAVESADEAALMAIEGVPTDTITEFDVTDIVGIKNIGEVAVGYPFLHAAGSGTNYNIVGWTREAYDTASNWVVSFVGMSDGIETIAVEKSEKADNVIYDLSGRRVANITRTGLYIINGKKVIVKK